jgi:drug/metabolite transporter (DMT)-like permease
MVWTWVVIVLFAAIAQTARNAAQRSLVALAGTLGATLARFLYGIPFAAAVVLLLHSLPATSGPVPPFTPAYFGWLALGAVSQLAATAFMLFAMKQRNFVVGVAFSKTDALLVALFGTIFLHEVPGGWTVVAIVLATAGVVMLSLPKAKAAAGGFSGAAALYGLASGAGFAFSAVGYRGAALQLPGVSALMVAAWGVLFAQTLQTVLLGGWLAVKAPQALRATVTAWRVSLTAGSMGAVASLGWFGAFALTSAANVRTLGMVEVVFSYLVSRRWLREHLSRAEQGGLVLVMTGLLALMVAA